MQESQDQKHLEKIKMYGIYMSLVQHVLVSHMAGVESGDTDPHMAPLNGPLGTSAAIRRYQESSSEGAPQTPQH